MLFMFSQYSELSLVWPPSKDALYLSIMRNFCFCRFIFLFVSASESLHTYTVYIYIVSICPLGLTELPGRLDVDIVVTAADADDDAQRLELFQVLSGQGDGVVHHGPYCFIQHLRDIREEETSSFLSYYIRIPSIIIICVRSGRNPLHSYCDYYVIIVLNQYHPCIYIQIDLS